MDRFGNLPNLFLLMSVMPTGIWLTPIKYVVLY